MGLTALCPGTFDPVTNGHLDIIGRTSATFDRVVVGVLENPSKQPLFSGRGARRDAGGGLRRSMANVEVRPFSGLLVDYAKAQGADVDREGPAGRLRLRIRDPDGADEPPARRRRDVVHAHEPEWSFLSSSLVKEVARFGGDVGAWCPTTCGSVSIDRLGRGTR